MFLAAAGHATDDRAAAAPNIEGLYFVVDIQEFGVLYTDPPTAPASHVFFSGQTNTVRMQVQNRSTVTRRLHIQERQSDEAYHVTAQSMPVGAVLPRMFLPPTLEIVGHGTPRRMAWRSEIELGPLESAVWYAPVALPKVATNGMYVLLVTPRFLGATDEIGPHGPRVVFEVRDVKRIDDRVEVARRQLMHAYRDHIDDGPADRANGRAVVEMRAQELLSLCPNCSVAYEIQGLRALDEKRRSDASRLYQRAWALLSSRQDSLFVTHQDEQAWLKKLEALDRTVQSIRQP